VTDVSIIMPAWNAARYIGAAISSVCVQTFRNFELIVIDDGSTDNTPAIVASMARTDTRIRPVQVSHRGVTPARNKGLELARGRLVTFLDADDLWPQGRLARHVGYLDGHSEVAVISGTIVIFESHGSEELPPENSRTVQVLSVNLPAATFKRSTFDEVGRFDEDLDAWEDLDFLMRVYEHGLQIATEPEIALLHRRHDANMSGDRASNVRTILKTLSKTLARRRQGSYVAPNAPFPLKMPAHFPEHLASRLVSPSTTSIRTLTGGPPDE
jgi:glycosyltransferase involved in cell wall biosynthesis